MNINFLFNFILITIGFIIMGINIKKYSKIYCKFKFALGKRKNLIHKEFVIHRILMYFFLLAYLFVAIGIIFKHIIIGLTSVGFILFFGSIFVFVGISIQIKMLETINDTYLQTIKALVSTIECRDAYTRGHSEHVANLCTIICNKLPNGYKNKNMLKFAAFLHDIGKIGIPEHILHKSSKLTNEEFNIIKTHPQMGKNILENINGLEELSQWILYHHERIDGNGYYNVTKDNIPLEARIIAIADTFSALVTTRPYRQGLKYEQAIEIMKKSSDNQFDSEILDIFFSISREEIEKCRPNNLF